MAHLIAVNVGSPQVLPGSKTPTGIVKTPRTGPVMIDEAGVLGDAVLDRKHHGGPDQAVYIYLQSDYDWWVEELGHPLDPGTFGENLTIAGIDGETLAIGDRLTIGDVVLEVTMHRTPCATFARRMGDPRWVRRFARAFRPGAYTRVIAPGPVEAGMPVDYRPFDGDRITVAELMSLDGVAMIPPDLMLRLLQTPVHRKIRGKIENALAWFR